MRSNWGRVVHGRVVAAIVLLLCASSLGARAGAGPGTRVLEDDWVLGIGSFLTEFKTDASVGSGSIVGTTIRLEDQLGVEEDRSTFRLDGIYRFNERHALGFGLWSLDREGRTEIDATVEFDGVLYEVGAELSSDFDTSWLRVDWRYGLVRSDRGEAGISAGLSIYEFEVGLEGEATITNPDGTTELQSTRAEESILAPVPTIGFFINYAIRPNLLLRLRADLLDVEIDTLEGKVVDTNFLLEWYFSRVAGIGIGLNRSDISIRDSGDDPYLVDYSQSGLLGYLALAF